VRGISNLDDTRAGRRPAGLWVTPQKFKVNDGVGWSDLDKFRKNRCPFIFLHAWHFVHTFEHFFSVNSITPTFLFGSGNLSL